MPAVETPKLCRLEKLIRGEWVKVGDHSLLHPERYAERLAVKGIVGRATELDDSLQPTGKVHTVDVKTCPVCDEAHLGPYDGSCLL